MRTLAHTVYLESHCGVASELPHAGCALENPYVYDAAARELKAMAEQGLLQILDERTVRSAGDELIDRFSFVRLR